MQAMNVTNADVKKSSRLNFRKMMLPRIGKVREEPPGISTMNLMTRLACCVDRSGGRVKLRFTFVNRACRCISLRVYFFCPFLFYQYESLKNMAR